MRMRCGNLKEDNKYWLKEIDRKCIFCRKGKNNLEYYIEECKWTRKWFIGLKDNKKGYIMI